MKTTKAQKYLTIAILSILPSLTACNSSASKEQEKETGTGSPQEQRQGANIVRKRLDMLGSFSYITNIGSVNIIYTQGDYSIEVEGDSALIPHVKTSFDSNLLTVSMGTDGNCDINFEGKTSNVTMYVSCPELKCISICGSGRFESRGKWTGDDIQTGVLGIGSLKLDSIECNTFSMQVTAISHIGIGNLKAKEATILTRTNAIVDMNVDAEEFVVLNDGNPKMTLTGKATNLQIKNPKDQNLKNNME